MKFLILFFFFATSAMAATELTLKTPRETTVPVIIHRTALIQPLGVLVVAPGEYCDHNDSIFEDLGTEGERAGFTIIRFEWSFCKNRRESERAASDNYNDELEDMQTVLTFAQSFSMGDSQRIFIGGKSLGSIIAYQLFAKDPNFKGLVLLSPVCSYTTDAGDNPVPDPITLGEINYPGLDKVARPVLMAVGNRDPFCLAPLLYDFLKSSRVGRISVIVGEGDHHFRSYKDDSKIDELQSNKNTRSIIPIIINWLNVQTNKNIKK